MTDQTLWNWRESDWDLIFFLTWQKYMSFKLKQQIYDTEINETQFKLTLVYFTT